MAARWTTLADRLQVFALHAALYRLLGGRLVGRDTLLLTTVGRRSGRLRATPLFYVRDGGDFLIVASNGGDARYPAWWHNVRAEPRVHVQVGRDVLACDAAPATGADAVHLWPAFVAIHRGYDDYRRSTTRELTMFRLTPRTEALS
jgi:deazaflavin-dependent oxidoreductase (nitroreductase family)